jgi:pimeloyl-ACP methyl ester carboxylesterase
MREHSIHVSRVGSGPPLLFVNGLFQFRGAWQPIAKELQDTFTCISFDFPNQNTVRNGTEPDPNFDRPEQYEDYILHLLESLSLAPEETMICALSWGACLIRSLHLRRGVPFKGLAFIGLHCPELQEFYKLFHQEFQTLLDHGAVEQFMGTILLWFFSQEWWAANAPIHEILKGKFKEMYSREESLHAIHRSAIADFERDFPEGRFRCPTTLLSGEHDPIAPPKYVERYAREVGAAFRKVEGGHIFSGENPRLGAAAIKEALAEAAFCAA